MKKYLPVTVYNPIYGNCSNNGVTETHARKLVVECPRGHVSEEDVEKGGYVVLELSVAYNRTYFHLPGKPQTMFGGSFVYAPDSRWNEMFGQYPLPVHDRFE